MNISNENKKGLMDSEGIGAGPATSNLSIKFEDLSQQTYRINVYFSNITLC